MRIAGWLDRARGAFSTQAPDAVLTGQLQELRGQLPIIYAGMAFCSLFVAATFYGRAPATIGVFEGAFLLVVAMRMRHWMKIAPDTMTTMQKRRELRNLVWMSVGLGVFCSASAFAIDPLAHPDERIALVLWVAYCGVGCGMSLAVFKPASRIAMTLAIIPYAIYVATVQPGTGRVVALIILVAVPVGIQQYGRMADFFRALTLRNLESLARNKDAEDRRRQFLEIATDWAWETDADNRIVYLSGHFAAFAGRPLEEFIGLTGRKFFDLIEMELLSAHIDPREALKTRAPYRDAVYQMKRGDGARAYISSSAQPRFSDDGSFLGYVGWSRDITREYAAQIALRDGEQRFRDFAESASDWFWEADAELRYAFISDRAAVLTGVDHSAVIGAHMGGVDGDFPPNERARFLEALEKRAAFKDVVSALTMPDRSKVWVSQSGVPIFKNGVFDGYRGVCRNVTAQVAAREEIEESRRKLAETNLWLERQVAQRTAELAARNEFLDDVIESMADGLVVFDETFHIENRNMAAIDMSGLPAAMWRDGADIRDMLAIGIKAGLYDYDSVDAYFHAMRASLKNRGYFTATRRQTDGRVIAEQIRMRPHGGYVVSYSDITELKRHQEEATARTALLDEVFESMAEGILVLDEETNIVAASQKCAELSGTALSAWTKGSSIVSLLEEAVKNGVYGSWTVDTYVATMFENLAVNGAFHTTRHQGDGRVVAESVRPRPNGGLVITYHDITDLKRREAELDAKTRELEARTALLNEVINSMGEGLLVLDEFSCVVVANDKCAALSGTEPAAWERGMPIPPLLERLIEQGCYAYGSIYDYVADMTATLDRGEIFRPLRRQADGRVIQENLQRRPKEGVVVTYHDITDLKNREEQLERLTADLTTARDAAEAGARAKAQFLANMSHEIRTPMNGVIGMASLLLESGLTTKQHEMAQVIVNSGDNLLMIINDILDFSRLEAGKMAIVEEPFDLRAVVEDVAALLALKVQEKSLELMIRYAPDLGSTFIGDAGRIRQAVTNLVGNAVKFTEYGHVLVAVSGRRRGEIADIEIAVEDTGCGIPAEKLDAIFQAFEQADGSAARRHDGTGLGLAITRRLVEAMDGEVVAESVVGEGSTFRIRLPIRIDERALSTIAKDQTAVAGLRALVVDDNKVNRDILVEQLAAWGISPLACASGEEAMAAGRAAAAKGDPFEIVVLDHQMPNEDGVALAGRMRDDAAFATAPRILLTSAGRKGDPGESVRSLFDAYLVKPARASMLFDTIVSALSDNARADVAAAAASLRAAETAKSAPTTADSACAGLKVLVAEDNVVNQMVISAMLDALRCESRLVSNGVEAVKAFAEFTPDVVLMDISMPEMDGGEACRRIRAIERERGAATTPIIGVTAHAMRDDRQRCLDAGMDDHLPKPVKQGPLLEALVKWGAGRLEKARKTA
jgi:PAS domain S-box-containing protein